MSRCSLSNTTEPVRAEDESSPDADADSPGRSCPPPPPAARSAGVFPVRAFRAHTLSLMRSPRTHLAVCAEHLSPTPMRTAPAGPLGRAHA
ncbi:hypothetical protein [Thauera humireducens]|uniref:hypothetical protein n=1 Tax=Thauera humireducens TaxID=1134435 RepID=UPI00311E8C86